MSREQSVVTAYHEAGHVVMAMAHGFAVTRMSNIASDIGLGHAAWQVPDPPTTASRVGSVLVYASGMAADFLHWGRTATPDDPETLKGYRDDEKQADIHLAELGDAGQFGVYVAVATRFLQRQDVWLWVAGFADLMVRAGTVDGQALIQRASKQVPTFGMADEAMLKRAVEMSKRGLL